MTFKPKQMNLAAFAALYPNMKIGFTVYHTSGDDYGEDSKWEGTFLDFDKAKEKALQIKPRRRDKYNRVEVKLFGELDVFDL